MTTSFRKSLTAVVLATSLVAMGAPSAHADFMNIKPNINLHHLPKFKPHPPHHPGWGPGIGLGLGLIGAAAASAAYANQGYCHTERRYDEYGDYIGRVRVCE